MQTNSYGNNLRILRGAKFKKFLDHDFAAAQPLSKSGGDQVNCTIVHVLRGTFTLDNDWTSSLSDQDRDSNHKGHTHPAIRTKPWLMDF
jgi:hypothetical protein